MKTVLLLRPDKAGDLIKTLPALRALVTLYPDTHVHLVLSKANESLLKYEPKITFSVLPSDWNQLNNEELKKKLTEILAGRSFHTGINLLCDPFSEAERLLSVVPAQEKFSIYSESLPSSVWPMTFRAGSPRHRDESLNIAELLEQSLEIELMTKIDKMNRAPVLGNEDLAEAQQKLNEKKGKWLAVCPFAGNQNRTHPIAKWKKFLKVVSRNKSFEKIILFGAPADSQHLEEIRNHLGNPTTLILATPSSFRTLSAFLGRCDKVIAVDSGPLHLSLALGIPSLGFLSGGDYRRWFSHTSAQDRLVHRGLLDRYPSFLEMWWHFSRWA